MPIEWTIRLIDSGNYSSGSDAIESAHRVGEGFQSTIYAFVLGVALGTVDEIVGVLYPVGKNTVLLIPSPAAAVATGQGCFRLLTEAVPLGWALPAFEQFVNRERPASLLGVLDLLDYVSTFIRAEKRLLLT
jgi:hypothetical protein